MGQIRQRTERLFFFPDLEHVQHVIEELMKETEERPALVKEDHTVIGRDTRYIHLLGDHPVTGGVIVTPAETLSAEERVSLEERIKILEVKVEKLFRSQRCFPFVSFFQK